MKSVILDYAIGRKEEAQTIYQYNYEESLNTISINNRKVTYINSNSKDISLQTKTLVISESDDDDNINIIELQTKTKIAQESDDEFNLFLE